jgi:hypothetical protein
MKGIDSGYTLETVGGRNPQDVVDLVLLHLLTGIPNGCVFGSNSMNLDPDDSAFLRKLEKRLIPSPIFTAKRR